MLALEREGLEIREAGTRSRPSSDAFEYKPSATSPIYTNFGRRSVDSSLARNSWRSSKQSTASTDRATQTEDIGTQTMSPTSTLIDSSQRLTASPSRSLDGESNSSHNYNLHNQDGSHRHSNEDSYDDSHDEMIDATPDESYEPLHEVAHAHAQTAAAPQVISRVGARLVTIPKRIPPTLPPRNPNRGRPLSGNANLDATTASDGVREAARERSVAGSSDYDARNGAASRSSSASSVQEREIRRLNGFAKMDGQTDGFDEVSLNGVGHGGHEKTQAPSAGMSDATKDGQQDEMATPTLAPSREPHENNEHPHDYTEADMTTPTEPREPKELPNGHRSSAPPDASANEAVAEVQAPLPSATPLHPLKLTHPSHAHASSDEFHSVPSTPVPSTNAMPGGWTAS